jgi:UDP-3-O-[3-hydroxymyristoyl] N-acetylglucosamine deacetylase
MFTANQQTIARRASLSGIGVHSGEAATLTFAPADAGSGIVFVRPEGEVKAVVASVSDARLGTTLTGPAGAHVLTIEHVMAAIYGLGIDNVRVELSGPEAPIMDGSSLAHARALIEAGRMGQPKPRRRLLVLEPVAVEDGDKWAELLPAEGFDGLSLDVAIAFDDPAIGRQQLALDVTPETFTAEIAPARTFGFLRDLEPLRASGRALGSSYDNTVVVNDGRVLNAEGLRFEDEFVRHKMLDAIGDLALLGAPLVGRFRAFKPGHAMSAALMRTLLERTDAWSLSDE